MAPVTVLDLGKFDVAETKYLELQKLHSTCKEWGIFQVVNHGVSSSLLEKLKNEIHDFFKQPLAEKMRYAVQPGDFEGYGKAITNSIEDVEDIVDLVERFYMMINPIKLRRPHLFPMLPSSLRETLETYFSELQEIAKTLIGLVAEALVIDKKEMEELFGENAMQSMRMNYYPTCPKPDEAMGFSPHSDGTFITILLQLNGVDGLEVKKDGFWVPVELLHGALLVNVGDLLELVSNGIYKSIEHRVTVNPYEERTSLAMFFNPKLDAVIGPSPKLINEENPPLFKTMSMEDYLKFFFSRKLQSKSNIEAMRLHDIGKAIV